MHYVRPKPLNFDLSLKPLTVLSLPKLMAWDWYVSTTTVALQCSASIQERMSSACMLSGWIM